MPKVQAENYTLTFCKEDWMRIQQALRAHARDHYRKMDALDERGSYYEILWEEYGYCNALADDIEWRLP
jgi:hypothetical protein